MFKQLSELQKAFVYTGLVFVMVFMIIFLPIEKNSSLFMFVPLIAVLLTLLLTGEAFTKDGWKQLGLHRFQMKTAFWAFIIPLVPILIGYTIVWLTELGNFGYGEELAPYKGREMFIVFGFFINIVIASLTVSLGEEIGWRGYLASKLKHLGLKKAILLNGFIWGLFHLPIMALSDVYHADVNLFLFIPLFMATVMLAGSFITYVRYVTGSVWPSVLAHSAHNGIWLYGELFTQNPQPIVSYITGDAGIVLIILYLFIFMWIVKKHKHQELL